MIALIIGLLVVASIIQMIAWYGHFKYPNLSFNQALIFSLLWVVPEYIFLVRGNQLGARYGLSKYQLRIISMIISVVVFIPLAWILFKESPKPKHIAAFALLLGAAYLVMSK